jgi:hypothetical protein
LCLETALRNLPGELAIEISALMMGVAAKTEDYPGKVILKVAWSMSSKSMQRFCDEDLQ